TSTKVKASLIRKYLSVRVFPGLAEVRTRFFRLIKRLINEDLPTLERPASAISDNTSCGYCSALTALMIYSALFIFIFCHHQCILQNFIKVFNWNKSEIITNAFWNVFYVPLIFIRN